MGGIIGGKPSMPSAPRPAPVAAPAPAPAPIAPAPAVIDTNNGTGSSGVNDAEAAKQKALKRRQAGTSAGTTLLGGSTPLGGASDTGSKTLLGG